MEQDDASATTTSPPPSTGGRRLNRSAHDRVLAGVAGGLGEYFGVDAVLFRIAFVALTIAGGSGLAIYFLAWLLIPEVDDETPAGLPRLGRLFHKKPILAIIGVIVAINLLSNGFWWGDHGGGHDAFWGVVLLIMGVAFLVSRDRPHNTPDDSGSPSAGPDPAPEPDYSVWPPVVPVAVDLRPPRARPFLTPVTISVILIGAGAAALVGVSLQTFLGLALLTVGAAMLVGARFGRARGLLVIGLLLAAMATAASVTDVSLAGGTGERDVRPAVSEQVHPYRLGAGELRLDLRALRFEGTQAISARVGVGHLQVTVPPGVKVVAHTRVGLGDVNAFGHHDEGVSVRRTFTHKTQNETAKELDLNLRVGVGEVEVEYAAA